MARAHVLISGRVQGVNFRYSTLMEAQFRGVTGWVRNNPDGRVEAVFEGDAEAVRQMVEWCHQGPSMARVDHVDVTWQPFSGEFDDFRLERGVLW
ncbi:MAG: acylphosphatase [Chloroflexota bacterium]